MSDVHFANSLGTWLAPVLLSLRAMGFFEWYVYVPAMTLASVPLYRYVAPWYLTGPVRAAEPVWQRRVRLSACYAVCWLLPTVLAVALKTLIVEEMDYDAPVWYAPLVSILHFYIASVIVVYLWMLRHTRRPLVNWACAGYVQIGLIGGYLVAGYRLTNEQWSWLDPTMAIGGLIVGMITVAHNWVIVRRIRFSEGLA